jgi:MoxR-like ATPase
MDRNLADQLARALQAGADIILGKERELRLAIACLLARGHLLVEDLPGVGKTTLAHLLARLLGLEYARIQFTSDLLPADIIGASIFERAAERFRFHPGPIFAELVLADEINRATPRAQSALLEAMEERQVTVEGETHPLPMPFFVIATQNPSFQIGTFPLPESQLDRFLMRLRIGYPTEAAEKALLAGEDRRELLFRLQPALGRVEIRALQQAVSQVHAAPPIIDYCYDIIAFTRHSPRFLRGLSPRAGLALLRAARAWALLAGRDAVYPEDVQAVLGPCVGHRLEAGGGEDNHGVAEITAVILAQVPVR